MNQNFEIWQANWKQPDSYNYQSGGNRWQLYLIREILKNVDEKIETILDVGCGAGNKTELLAELFPDADTTGVDFASEGIQKAVTFRENKRLHFVCADINSLMRGGVDSYQLISCFQVLEHLEDWKGTLKKICDAAEKYVVISVPTGRMRKYEVYEGHLRNYKKGQIEAFMCRAGFEAVKTYYAGFPFYSPLERDVLNFTFHRHRKSVQTFGSSPITKYVHQCIYFLYRYCSCKTIGDQFIGLFKKTGGKRR